MSPHTKSGPKLVTVTRAETSAGVELLICDNGVRGAVITRRFEPGAEAGEVFDALLELPVETRRALQLLIHEHGDTFTGSAHPKRVKKHPWPPRSR